MLNGGVAIYSNALTAPAFKVKLTNGITALTDIVLIE
jgi:hypothetical protein